MLNITVLNRRDQLSDPLPGTHRVYVGRGTPLGNPFPMRDKSQEERDRVCDLYCEHLRNNYPIDGPVRNELERLLSLAQDGPLELVCWCAPLRCHAHFIRDALLGMARQRDIA